MKESIHIQNFGPIIDVNIPEIKPMTIFVGKSGSGKSTIVKIIALFRWIYKMMCIRTFLRSSGVEKTFRFRFDTYLKNNEQNNFVNENTKIEYRNGSVTIVFENKKLKGANANVPKEELSLEKISFIADKRSAISDLQAGSLYRRCNSFYLENTYTDYIWASQFVDKLDVPFLGIRFEVNKTKGGVKHQISSLDDNKKYKIDLNEASSGIQNSVPILVIFEYFSKYYNLTSAINRAVLSYASISDTWTNFKAISNVSDFSNKRVTICLEEPEISLYPNAQSGILKFVVDKCFRSNNKYDMNVLMTTHSPYLINYLNVLIQPKNNEAHINVDNLAVYFVGNGNAIPLIGKDNEQHSIIDTTCLSEEMETIYNNYLNVL